MAEAYGGGFGLKGGGNGGNVGAVHGNGPLGAMRPQSPWAQFMANYWRQSGQPIPGRVQQSPWAQILQKQNYQATPQMPQVPQGPAMGNIASQWLNIAGPSQYGINLPSYGYFGSGQQRPLMMP